MDNLQQQENECYSTRILSLQELTLKYILSDFAFGILFPLERNEKLGLPPHLLNIILARAEKRRLIASKQFISLMQKVFDGSELFVRVSFQF
jgi:hypothetical protein